MGTLWSELAPVADDVAEGPRVYADANVPAGVVGFMRVTLGWDVLFVIEHPDLRRARDIEHFRLARQLRRTLITIDRDYLDDGEFPPRRDRGRARAVRARTSAGLQTLLEARRSRAVSPRAATASWRCRSKDAKLQVFPELGAG